MIEFWICWFSVRRISRDASRCACATFTMRAISANRSKSTFDVFIEFADGPVAQGGANLLGLDSLTTSTTVAWRRTIDAISSGPYVPSALIDPAAASESATSKILSAMLWRASWSGSTYIAPRSGMEILTDCVVDPSLTMTVIFVSDIRTEVVPVALVSPALIKSASSPQLPCRGVAMLPLMWTKVMFLLLTLLLKSAVVCPVYASPHGRLHVPAFFDEK